MPINTVPYDTKEQAQAYRDALEKRIGAISAKYTFNSVAEATAKWTALAVKPEDNTDLLILGTPNKIYYWDSNEVTKVVFVQEADVNTKYTNQGGSGDRIGDILVSYTPELFATAVNGDILINGIIDSVFGFANGVSSLDKTISFEFRNQSKIISEIKWLQGTAATHGVWKVQGSNDKTTWEDVSPNFTLGGATEQIIPLNSIEIGYYNYRLIGVSGVVSGSPFIYEVEFKIEAGSFIPKTENIPASISSKLVEAYFFNHINGTTVKGEVNGNDIDLTLPTNPNYTPSAKGIRLQDGLIQTPLLNGVWGITILYKVKVNTSGGFMISGGSSSGSGTFPDTVVPSEINKILGGGRDWHDFQYASNTGQGAKELNRGEYIAYHRGHNQAYNSIYGLGGRHSTTTSRLEDFEISMAFFWNKEPTTDELNELGLFIRQKAKKTNIQLLSDDAKEKQDLYIILGESNSEGKSTLANLSASDRSLILRQTNYVSRVGGANGDGLLNILEMGLNQQQTDLLEFGPEFGVAFQRRLESVSRNNCTLVSVGQGSTYLRPSDGGNPTTTWNTNESFTSGLFYNALTQIHKSMQESLNKNIGFNEIIRIGFWIGLNDALNITFAPDVATYQGYVQDFYDALVTILNGYTIELIIFKPHNSDPTSDPTALSNIRTAIDNVDVANANVTAIDTDGYGLEADGVHYDAAGSKAMGIILHG